MSQSQDGLRSSRGLIGSTATESNGRPLPPGRTRGDEARRRRSSRARTFVVPGHARLPPDTARIRATPDLVPGHSTTPSQRSLAPGRHRTMAASTSCDAAGTLPITRTVLRARAGEPCERQSATVQCEERRSIRLLELMLLSSLAARRIKAALNTRTTSLRPDHRACAPTQRRAREISRTKSS